MKSLLNFISVFIVSLACLSGCTNNSIYLEDNEAARANAKLAHAYIDHGQYPEAKAKLLVATHQAPHEAFVWDAWAYYADSTAEAEEADIYYRHAIRLQPRWGMLHNNYGVFLCRQTRYELALAQFNLAIQDANYLYPEQAYHNAALCSARMGNQLLADSYEKKAKAYR